MSTYVNSKLEDIDISYDQVKRTCIIYQMELLEGVGK